MKLQPLGANVLLAPIAMGQTSKGGLLLPDIGTSKLPYAYADVVAVGEGATNSMGITKPLVVKVGDVVAYAKNSGLELPIEDETGERVMRLVTENYILGIVTELARPTALTGLDGRLLMMQPGSRARADSTYETIEKTEIARREGWLDINPDGSHDHVDDAIPYDPPS